MQRTLSCLCSRNTSSTRITDKLQALQPIWKLKFWLCLLLHCSSFLSFLYISPLDKEENSSPTVRILTNALLTHTDIFLGHKSLQNTAPRPQTRKLLKAGVLSGVLESGTPSPGPGLPCLSCPHPYAASKSPLVRRRRWHTCLCKGRGSLWLNQKGEKTLASAAQKGI